MDIEGTTTSVKFVYDELFPYFLRNIGQLNNLKSEEKVQEAFKATVHLANKLENHRIKSVDEIIATLKRWCEEDKKVTPLKTIQGIIWEKGYLNGDIKGHLYDEVADSLKGWDTQQIQMGVFSSGSIAAQKLLFGHSIFGDLTIFFQNYFDTTTGGKRDIETYEKIVVELGLDSNTILFLSDITEELEAADKAGMQTCQLVRQGTEVNWKNNVSSFEQIIVK